MKLLLKINKMKNLFVFLLIFILSIVNFYYFKESNNSFFTIFILFLLGICFGSFINNIGYRIKDYLAESEFSIKGVIKATNTPTFSICPKCKKKIKFYDNIPIFSWLILKGKCRNCKTEIPFMYLFSEIFFGLILINIFLFVNDFLLTFYIYLLFIFIYIIYIIKRKD